MTNQSIRASRDALATINALTICPTTTPCADDCIHARCDIALRYLMIDIDETPIDDDAYAIPTPLHDSLRDALATLIDSPYYRDDITNLALSHSLCPLHMIDYAICFDDDDDECATIRAIHPSHDT